MSKKQALASIVEEQLVILGEDPDREGLVKTPARVAKSLQDLTSGYKVDIRKLVNGAVFKAADADEMIVVRDIEFYSLCEHHMLPFFGVAHVAYIPHEHIIGLSKLPRIVDMYARRLQVQERLTTQIAKAVQNVLTPLGVGVVLEAQHLCMMMRGVAKQKSMTTTSCTMGVFRDKPETRSEFLSMIRR